MRNFMLSLFASLLLGPVAASQAAAPHSAPSRATDAPLRLMTYNIRLDIASDGENAWPHRRQWVAAQIEWLRPDLFGMQEVLPSQRTAITEDLPRYRTIGGGRDGGERGEASPIGFDTAKFELRDSGLFWLSPTPAVPSKGWDAAFNRVVTWARLNLRGTAHEVLAINTHLDHVGEVARRESARQIAQWIEANARPCERVLLFGDFNTKMDSAPLRLLRDSSGLRDARALSKSAPFGPAGTFNGFRNPPQDMRTIDHVLLGEGVEVERYLVLAQNLEGRWPSDHFPVLVDVTLRDCRR